VFVEIEKHLGRSLPLSSLLPSATIAHLASVLEDTTSASSWPHLVPLKAGGSRPPLFCVHPIHGDVISFAALARHLDDEQPVYGLRAADESDDVARDVPGLAQRYVEAIRAVQPAGPYRICGYSFGAAVALEMAQQLRQEGEAIGLLGIVDLAAPTSDYYRPPLRPRFIVAMARSLPSWLASPDQRSTFVRDRAHWLEQRLQARQASGDRDARAESGTATVPLPEGYERLARRHRKALAAYRPGVYPGRILLFRAATQPLFCSHDPIMGWGALAADGVEVREVPGNHLEMMRDPQVRILARELQACLDRDGDGLKPLAQGRVDAREIRRERRALGG
jgi:thioesterase domain-containing protein